MDLRLALFYVGFLTASALGENSSSKARSCSDVRQVYSAKGFSLTGVPQTEISGEHLRICPQGYTCCTSQMEETFSNLSRREFEGRVKEAGRSLQAMLNAQHKNFDGYFLDLLNKSERSLQDMFSKTYGELYTSNAKIFSDLYTELRHYYRGANLNLEEALHEFWTRLLERLFRRLNPQYQMSDEFLDCVVKHAETLKPFGEAPRELKLKVTRPFIAARSFVQGLDMASDVVRKVAQVPLSPECTRAIMKLTYCPHCRGLPSIKPCTNYCRNVMKGCLANQADLHTEWRSFVDSMLQVAERFNGMHSMETFVDMAPLKISDAIMNMNENGASISSKVFQGCGNPKLAGTRSSVGEEKKKRVKVQSEEKEKAVTGLGMDKLVSDVSGKLREMQLYWVQLPNALCNDAVTAGPSSEDKCWNGMNKGRYLPEVMGDGLASQINNPEVDIDITKPDITIRQQIMQLKIMTNRLKNAYNGNDVDFQDTSDDISGSGSAMGCPEEVCPSSSGRMIVPNTNKPNVYGLPNEKKQGVMGAGSHSYSRPHSLPLLLPLLPLAGMFRR
ncbi:glypican-1 [Acipenser ruthenus]|uniref:glypican-1 n=1 Tax=Acipenser ruthenus TaxID=7906 RepID=UPI00145A13EA|nr:glypican-1 [Acipenser ruthenus]